MKERVRERTVDEGLHLFYIEPIWMGFLRLHLWTPMAEELEPEEPKVMAPSSFVGARAPRIPFKWPHSQDGVNGLWWVLGRAADGAQLIEMYIRCLSLKMAHILEADILKEPAFDN